MDGKLLAWARRVKRRGRRRLPALWLFTDAVRLPDPGPAIGRLPRGAAGVVLRPHGLEAAVIRRIATLCRERRLALSVAGDARLAMRLRAGAHLRGGRPPRPGCALAAPLTGSAHDAIQAWRCRRAGVLTFISPVFATASHPGARPLGALGWSRLARRLGPRGAAAALGGIDGDTVRRLPPDCVAVGAIGAWL